MKGNHKKLNLSKKGYLNFKPFYKKYNMKKIVKLILPMFMVGLIIYSCTKENEINDIQTIDYEKIGKEHNLGLDFIFNELKNKKISIDSKGNNFENLMIETKKSSTSFVEYSELTSNLNSKNIINIFNEYDKLAVKDIKYRRKGTKSNSNPIIEMKDQVELTAFQIKFFDQLDNVISNLDLGLDLTIEKINEIEKNILLECPKGEQFLLLSSTSIAKNSLTYWNNNLEKWLNLLNEDPKNKTFSKTVTFSKNDWGWFSDTLKSMGKSDVVGGVIGLCVAGPPGAVAGACYSSAGRGVVALFDAWGLW